MPAIFSIRGLIMTAAGVLATTACFAQADPQPTVDDYVCRLTPKACEGEGDAIVRTPRKDERGFSLRTNTLSSTLETRSSRPHNVRRPVIRAAAQPGARLRRAMGVSGNDMMITFANASAELTPGAKVNASRAAQALAKVSPMARFRIEGHTNAVGTADRNRELSERRAVALIDFLVSQGVDRGRLEAKGYGFDRPLSGRSPSAPENRRVEVAPIP